MKRLVLVGAVLLATGCAAVVTPHGTYLEPLPFALTVAPSVVAVEPPPYVNQLRPLPEVYIYPNRPVYSYGGMYYNYWNGGWYYGRERSGPWYNLPRNYHPRGVHRR